MCDSLMFMFIWISVLQFQIFMKSQLLINIICSLFLMISGILKKHKMFTKWCIMSQNPIPIPCVPYVYATAHEMWRDTIRVKRCKFGSRPDLDVCDVTVKTIPIYCFSCYYLWVVDGFCCIVSKYKRQSSNYLFSKRTLMPKRQLNVNSRCCHSKVFLLLLKTWD